MQVSHETIDRSVFVQSRGVLKTSLLRHLRRRRTMRRSTHATTKGQPGSHRAPIHGDFIGKHQGKTRGFPASWFGEPNQRPDGVLERRVISRKSLNVNESEDAAR